VVRLLAHRTPGEEYKSIHPPIEEMEEPDCAVRQMVEPTEGTKKGDRIRYVQFTDSMFFAPITPYLRAGSVYNRYRGVDLGVSSGSTIIEARERDLEKIAKELIDSELYDTARTGLRGRTLHGHSVRLNERGMMYDALRRWSQDERTKEVTYVKDMLGGWMDKEVVLGKPLPEDELRKKTTMYRNAQGGVWQEMDDHESMDVCAEIHWKRTVGGYQPWKRISEVKGGKKDVGVKNLILFVRRGGVDGDYKIKVPPEEPEPQKEPCDAIILHPALGFPGVVGSGGNLRVILLAKNNANKKYFDGHCLSYCTWEEKDSKRPTLKYLDKIQSFNTYNANPSKEKEEGYVINNSYRLSKDVYDKYKAKGYSEVVILEAKAPKEDGLYHLISFDGESKVMREMLEDEADRKRVKVNNKQKQEKTDELVTLYHPFKVFKKNTKYLNIATLADTHLAMRWYEYDLKMPKGIGFCNYNKVFAKIMDKTKSDDTHITFILGDLIDYNRGFDGKSDFRNIDKYVKNRNWLLFYHLLLENYPQPIFTVLGNHDYRINPHQPLPRKPIIGGEAYNIAYDLNLTRREVWKKIYEMDDKVYAACGSDLTTDWKAIYWYTFVINPFLDYTFPYRDQTFAMLDWNREEDIEALLPWAANSLSKEQYEISTNWKKTNRNKKIKVVGFHQTLYNPCDEVGSKQLKKGEIYSDEKKKHIRVDIYGKKGKDPGFLLTPFLGGGLLIPDQLMNGTFYKCRKKFIDFIGEDKNIVNLVLSGHCHRHGIYQIGKDRVYQKAVDKGSEFDNTNPVIVTMNSSGPIGFKNIEGISKEEEGSRHIKLVAPSYTKISFNSNCTKIKVVNPKDSTKIKVREVVQDSKKYNFTEMFEKGMNMDVYLQFKAVDETTKSYKPIPAESEIEVKVWDYDDFFRGESEHVGSGTIMRDGRVHIPVQHKDETEPDICFEVVLKNKYLFSWDNVPGSDNERFIRFLRDDLAIWWVENAKIKKSPDLRTIKISMDNHSAKIIMDEKKEKATLDGISLKVGKNGEIYKVTEIFGKKYENNWCSKGHTSTDGIWGYFDDYEGDKIGTPQKPMVFEIGDKGRSAGPGLNVFLRFQNKSTGGPLPPGITVEVWDYNSLWSNVPLGSGIISSAGRVHISIKDKGGDNPDVFFKVKLAGKTIGRKKVDKDWESRGKVSTNGVSGYFDDYEGDTLGSKNDPLVYVIDI
jgi:methyl-coenzyme M reductase gamma subunit